MPWMRRPGVGLLAGRCRREAGVVLTPPLFFHPQQANICLLWGGRPSTHCRPLPRLFLWKELHNVMRTLKSILFVLSTGYIFVYFSEYLFWSRVRPGASLADWGGTWIAYLLMAFVFIVLVSYFRVKNIWALFLAGAAFGWIGEGIVVQTAYDMLPLSISFTALAWHALVTVWIGWFAIRKSLISSNSWATLKLACVIGFVYGLWAISWWLEPDGGVSSVSEFAAFSLITTVFVILAYWLANWSSSESLVFNRWAVVFAFGILVLFFCFVTAPNVPVAAIILPVLFGLVYLGLSQNRNNESEGSILDTLSGQVSIWKYLSLLALPATSILVYALAMSLSLQWHTNWVLYLIATPLGFILFGISLYKSWRKKSVLSAN